MALAICLGAVAGIVGFLPLLAATRAVKHVTSTSNFSYATILIVAVIASAIVLVGAVIICALLDKAKVLAFAGAEAAGLIVFAIVFGLRKGLQK